MVQPNVLQRLFNNPLFMTILFALFWGLGVYTDETSRHGFGLVFHVVISLSFGAVMALLFQRQMRRFDETIGIQSLAQRVTLQHAIKTSSVPDDSETRDLLPGYLDYIKARQARQRRGNRIVLPVLVLIYALNAVVQHSFWWIFIGVVFIGITLWSLAAAKRSQQHIPELRAKLPSR